MYKITIVDTGIQKRKDENTWGKSHDYGLYYWNVLTGIFFIMESCILLMWAFTSCINIIIVLTIIQDWRKQTLSSLGQGDTYFKLGQLGVLNFKKILILTCNIMHAGSQNTINLLLHDRIHALQNVGG